MVATILSRIGLLFHPPYCGIALLIREGVSIVLFASSAASIVLKLLMVSLFNLNKQLAVAPTERGG
jgi:hypothetical protein